MSPSWCNIITMCCDILAKCLQFLVFNNYRIMSSRTVVNTKTIIELFSSAKVLQSNANLGADYADDHDGWCRGQSTHGGGGVGHDLGPAVGESNLVTSSSVVTVTLFVGVEVAEGVVIFDGVGVLVDRHLVGVGHGGGGAVGGDSGGSGHDGGQEGGGENSLKHET